MAGIVAYLERTTPIGTHLRDEWRIVPFSKYTSDQITAWLGPHWFSSSAYRFPRFILEHRYIREGVDEGWKPFDLFPTREKALDAIDQGATPVNGGLAKVKLKRAEAREKARREADDKRLAEWEADERRRKGKRADEAFDRLMASPKYAIWAQRWNEFAATHQDDPALRAAVLADRSLYDAATTADTVPARVKAIKAFLKRYERAAGKSRHSSKTPMPPHGRRRTPRKRPMKPQSVKRRWREYDANVREAGKMAAAASKPVTGETAKLLLELGVALKR